jgi:hypothetical protein
MNFRLGVAKPRISVKEGDLRMKVRVLSFECKAFLSIPRSKQKVEMSRINSTKGRAERRERWDEEKRVTDC